MAIQERLKDGLMYQVRIFCESHVSKCIEGAICMHPLPSMVTSEYNGPL